MCSLKGNIIALYIVLTVIPLFTKGQMELFNISDQYSNRLILINPAFCGENDALSVSLSTRKQWDGFTGAPKSSDLDIFGPMKKQNIAAGFHVQKSSFGIQSTTSLLGDYAYHIVLPNAVLSMGMSFIFSLYETRWEDIILYNTNDIALNQTNEKTYLPNFRLGVFYKNKDFFTGFAVHNLISGRAGNYYNVETKKIKFLPYQFFYHFGYPYQIDKDFQITPSLIASYNPISKFNAEISSQVNYNNFLGLGLSYQTKGNLVTRLNYNINHQTSIAYSYGFSTNKYVRQMGGSHEIYLKYIFLYDIKVENPR